MKIGLIIDYFKPFALGGAERSTRELAQALIERGHEPVILTPNYGAPRDEDDGGVPIHRYWFPKRATPGRMVSSLWSTNPAYYRLAGRLIAREARRRNLDLLHAQNTFVQVPTYYAARRLGLPCVATIRDLGSVCSIGHLAALGREPDHNCRECYRRCRREFMAAYWPDASPLFRARLIIDSRLKQRDLIGRQRLLRDFEKIIFVSRGLLDVYLRHGFPVAPERLAVAYNIPPLETAVARAAGPVPAEWNLPEGAPVIAYAGKLSLGKGAHVLFEAIPRVVERRPDAVFVLAGRRTPQVEPPPDLPARNVRVLGPIPPAQVHALLGRASLFVLPSIWPEPLSSAVLEALAFGVPVVGTATGGTPEQILDGENGYLIPPNDAVALAEAIHRALDDPPRLARMRQACPRILRERFDRQTIIREMETLYRAALERAPRTVRP